MQVIRCSASTLWSRGRIRTVRETVATLRRREIEPAMAILPPAGRGSSSPFSLVLPDRTLVRPALEILLGFGLARILGFAFQVTAGRLLGPFGFGQLTYALTVAVTLSMFVSTSPIGLSRFLARHAEEGRERSSYFVNWMAYVGLVLGASALVALIVAPLVGLRGWLLVGALANLAGVTALETYREIQRGLGRYSIQAAFYLVANGLQLAAIGALAWSGQGSPATFLLAYGLSGVATLALFLPWTPDLFRLARSPLARSRLGEIFVFMRPLMFQAIFWNVWFMTDVVLVQTLLGPAATGTYGAAKAIAAGLQIVPLAIAFVVTPQVARLTVAEARVPLARALALTLAIMLPLAAGVALLSAPLATTLFGGRYQGTAAPLSILAGGMVCYALKHVLGSLWLGLGRPVVDAIGGGLAMAVTLVLGLVLVPPLGITGAATAFAAGALAQLLLLGIWTLATMTRPSPQRDRIPTTAPGPDPGPESTSPSPVQSEDLSR